MVLRPVDDEVLELLLDVAVKQAEPGEVMPPVEGPPGWTRDRMDAFRDFHRSRYGGLEGAQRTVMFAIIVDGSVVGMIRMSLLDQPGMMETGMWLGQPHRGRGIGGTALQALLGKAGAVGAHTVIAKTTPGNAAALGVLRRRGAVLTEERDTIRASIDVPPSPLISPIMTWRS